MALKLYRIYTEDIKAAAVVVVKAVVMMLVSSDTHQISRKVKLDVVSLNP